MENKKLTITFIDPDPIPSWLSHYEQQAYDDGDEEDQESFSKITEAVEKFNDFLELHSCEKNNFHVPVWLPKVLGLQIQNAFVTVSAHEWRDWNYLYTYVFEIPETHGLFNQEIDVTGAKILFSHFESMMNNFDYFDGHIIGQHGQDGWYGGYEIVDPTELASALNPGKGWWHYVYKVDPPCFEGKQLDWHEAVESNCLVWHCEKPDEFNF